MPTATEMQNSAPTNLTPPSTPPVPPPANTPAPTKSHACQDGDCDKCLKGGMPMKKEILSFVTLIAIGVATVFFVLWVNEKRSLANALKQTASPSPAQENAVQSATAAQITPGAPAMKSIREYVDLPQPKLTSNFSVERALQERRSRRTFAEQPVTMAELSQVLWAAQGVTDKEHGYRTAPSGRSLYPFNTYVVIRNVTGVNPGLYQYFPDQHRLGSIGLANAGDLLTEAGVQENSQKAPVVMVLAGVYGKMVEKYPNSYVEATMMEAGHIGQNVYLQVEALGMGTVVTAGFDANKVGTALGLDPGERITYLIPFGHRAAEPAPKE